MPLWKRSRGPLTFEAFGVPIEVELSDRGRLEPYLTPIMPPGWRPSNPSADAGRFALTQIDDDSFEVRVGDGSWLQQASLDVAIGMLDSQMRIFIAANARDWVFVHAGSVVFGERAIVIPGMSFSGKTRLVAALIEAGAIYGSDEYAVFDSEGLVHPYPRPLSIRSDDGGPTEERHPHEFGSAALDASVELGLVVLTSFRPGATWEPNRLPRAAGLLALLANTAPAQERPEQCLPVLRRGLEHATVLESERGEAQPVAAALLAQLTAEIGSDSRPPSSVQADA